ncbi:class IIb bacteriocin, lactobin A/cerein 7B family, partial [Klebsiella aerogenes]|nr:class IIb bacteriocin, lactobin A/cerein 7B family [Klebsiella aerogenes]
MKELTFNEMESVSGGFNLVSAATGFASFVANSAAGFTSFA